MNESHLDFKKLFKHEDMVHAVMTLIIPMLILGVITYYVAYTSGYDDTYSHSWLMPFFYVPIFYYVYNRKWFRLKNDKESVKIAFTKIGFEKAVLRYFFLSKMHRYSIIALIAIGVLGILGLQTILYVMEEESTDFKNQEEIYKNELQKTVGMNEIELREYLIESIMKENNSAIKSWLTLFFIEENKKQAEIFDNEYDESISRKDAQNKIKELNDREIRLKVIQQIESFSNEKVVNMVQDRIESKKPLNDLDNNELYMILEYLLAIMIIPAIGVYTIFLLNPMSRFEYFQYYFAIGSLLIVKNSSTTELEKRKYMKMGIESYNQFIRNTMQMKIANMDSIKSAILIHDSDKLVELSNNFSKLMEKDNQLQLAQFFKTEYFEDKNLPTLITDSRQERIKNYFTFLIPTATTIIAVISLVIQR